MFFSDGEPPIPRPAPDLLVQASVEQCSLQLWFAAKFQPQPRDQPHSVQAHLIYHLRPGAEDVAHEATDEGSDQVERVGYLLGLVAADVRCAEEVGVLVGQIFEDEAEGLEETVDPRDGQAACEVGARV